MERVEASIQIARPPAAVWRVLTDFAAYPDWNPFIRRLEGDLALGARLTATFQPDGGRATTLHPHLTELRPEAEMGWLGHIVIPGLLDAHHRFELRAEGEGTLLMQSESFNGLLLPLFRTTLAATARSFRAMNEAMRERVEAAAVTGGAEP